MRARTPPRASQCFTIYLDTMSNPTNSDPTTYVSAGALMNEDAKYLGKSLNRRANDVVPVINSAIETVVRQATAAGRLGSGNTLHELMTQSMRVFTEEVQMGLQFVFNFTGNNHNMKDVKCFAGRVETVVMEKVVDGANRLGLTEGIVAPHVTKIRAAIAEQKERVIEDFAHGMMGENKLNKDPVISVINNQTNSPGAVQQVGLGDFSQTAFVQQHQPLIAAIERVLSSPEFAALNPQQQVAVSDIAGVVKEEAAKPQPDEGKLKRWGGRLIDLTRELGMRVATNDIVTLLGSIFGG
jgi:hypothetical protein